MTNPKYPVYIVSKGRHESMITSKSLSRMKVPHYIVIETQDEKKLSLTAVWIRMNDKMNRLKNLVLLNKENRVADESTIDSYKDITNYGIIAQIVQNGMWKK